MHHPPSLWLDAQIKLQFPKGGLHAILIPRSAYEIAQKKKQQAEVPIALGMCDAQPPIGNFGALDSRSG